MFRSHIHISYLGKDHIMILCTTPSWVAEFELSIFVALWSSGRHLASGSEGPGFESWLGQFDVECLGKALYMHFPHPTRV